MVKINPTIQPKMAAQHEKHLRSRHFSVNYTGWKFRRE